MCVNKRIQLLRQFMKNNQIDAYFIPSADAHQSEYVGDYFKCREFITGFTGSAGSALITSTESFLWTDGRYFLQAEEQLNESEIKLMKIGFPGVPTIPHYLAEHLPLGSTLGFDGRMVSLSDGDNYHKTMEKLHGKVRYDLDLIDYVWSNRPEPSAEPTFYLSERYSGESTTSKLSRIREHMIDYGTNVHIVTSLDDLCWIFNFRGNDVKYSPLSLGYCIIYLDKATLFINETKLDNETLSNLRQNNVTVLPYNDIYSYVKTFSTEWSILIDSTRINYALYKNIPSDITLIDKPTPSILMKAMKNSVELDNIRNAHIKDGIAMTKFMYWLKQEIKHNSELSEQSVSHQLEMFRHAQPGFLSPSFEPICGYKEHAAIVHYEVTPSSNKILAPSHLLLMDTGGNYWEGSTDVTRTFALGPITAEESNHFTLVLRSMLTLANASFVYGVGGHHLDILAREPFWKEGLDFNHGTGHGVGYLLSIHEGPANFRWRIPPDSTIVLEEGMVLTDEPGLYIAGSHGIRIENELVVRKGVKNEYGQFMYLEHLTFVPIDLDAINTNLLSTQERSWLNAYHAKVYELIGPYLTPEEQKWLALYTRTI